MATGLYIAMDFKPRIGGIAEHTHQMAKHLTELGEQVTVLTPSIPGAEEFDQTCGYPVIRFNRPSPTHGSLIKGFGRSATVAKMTIILFTTLRRLRPDYIILDHWDALTAISILLASKLMRIPCFLFAHRYEFAEKRNWILLRNMTVWAAARVICVSNYTRSLVLAGGVKSAKTTVIYNGFDLREIQSFREHSFQGRFPRVDTAFHTDSPSILSVSRLSEWKRIDRIIEAMPRVVSKIPKARYIVVGSGEDEEYLKGLAASSSVRESIMFLGPLTGDEKFECFDRCDIFALTSEGEGFGIVYMEAMGFGKPVIGGRSSGTLEAIADGENGLLVDSNNVEEIADAIVELLENPDEARRLGENGRRRVEDELNWTTSANKFRSVILDTLGMGR